MSYELRVARLISATPEEVFDAYADPEAQKIWFQLLSDPMIIENEVDLRVGGKWVSAWGFNPDEMFRETNVFGVVDRPHVCRRHPPEAAPRERPSRPRRGHVRGARR